MILGYFQIKYEKDLHQIVQYQFLFWWEVHCDLFGKHLKETEIRSQVELTWD
jgi:hypothetical protein